MLLFIERVDEDIDSDVDVDDDRDSITVSLCCFPNLKSSTSYVRLQ